MGSGPWGRAGGGRPRDCLWLGGLSSPSKRGQGIETSLTHSPGQRLQQTESKCLVLPPHSVSSFALFGYDLGWGDGGGASGWVFLPFPALMETDEKELRHRERERENFGPEPVPTRQGCGRARLLRFSSWSSRQLRRDEKLGCGPRL